MKLESNFTIGILPPVIRKIIGGGEHRYYLRGVYKGVQYRATLRKDGLISYNGKHYESPTAATKMIIKGRAVNGWMFWKFQNDAGVWVTLSHLRK